MINQDRLKQTFLELLNINSPSKNERQIADYLKQKLSSIGFDVYEDNADEKIGGNAGNIIATLKGNAPGAKKIFLGCHMDTVEPTDKLKVIFDGAEFRSDGNTILGADDKAGIAAIIEGAQSYIESGSPYGDFQVIANVSEENGLLGSKAMDNSLIVADFGYVFDTQKPVAGLTISAPSHDSIYVEIIGKAAHAGMAPEQGVSAILAASNAISKMMLGRVDEETTANVGVISGGKARNIIPDNVIIKAEARSRSEEKLKMQTEHMKNTFIQEAEKIGAVAKVEVEREYTGFRFSESDSVIKLGIAASKLIGIEPTFHEGGGGSDANIYNSAGIPTVVVGVGYDGAHSSTENISLEDLATAAKYCAALIQAAASGEY